MRCKKPFKAIGTGSLAAGAAVHLTWGALDAALVAGGVGTLGVLDSGAGIIGIFERTASKSTLRGDLHLELADGTEFTLSVPGGGGDIIYCKTGSPAPTWSVTPGANGGIKHSTGVVQLAFLGEYSAVGHIGITCSLVPTITTVINGSVIGGAGFSRKAGAQSAFSAVSYTTIYRAGYWYGVITGGLTNFGSNYEKDGVGTGKEIVTSAQMLAGRIGAVASTVEFTWMFGAYAGDNITTTDHNYVLANIQVTTNPVEDWIPCLVCDEGAGGDIETLFQTVKILEHARIGGATP